MIIKKNNFWKVFIAFVVLTAVIGGCAPSATTTTAFCGYLVGDGTYSSEIKEDNGIVYPGEEVYDDTSFYDFRTVPCNSRNYVINDGTKYRGEGENKEQIGDFHSPISASTSTRTPVLVTGEANWTLNQGYEPMVVFWEICQKYKCWNENENVSDDANFSSVGWNGMLSEKFLPAFSFAIKMAVAQLDDDIIDNTKRNEEIEKLMPQYFKEFIRRTHGHSDIDIFCGSGDSFWLDENNRGENGTFHCADVRFSIESVELDTEKLKTINSSYLDEQRLKQAEYLYGVEAAQCVLAIQDTVAICQEAGGTCVNNIDYSVCYETNGEANDFSPTLIVIPTEDFGNTGAGTSATPEATPGP
ncbi:hypothetical protein A2572_00445 [Candidatus Collierbacteria bacterium RIFOXYD1_FULL_40_9]|uniref:Uncharacterized protein n=1 Tax=Candidatus Collierbacteria bacterium RIFOXYD1_FULL_40_9 TaxID=1817731 RepID=A0A1F5FWI4_9BACT|nr:MAG: hypothetical protein A2572_00445 [Candidatus Collierbacteria bacterium RIFOXYD1_FULL_40_9]